MESWKGATYRLMQLTRSGRVWFRARGSLIYLQRIGALARSSRGRQWIDLNFEPAVLVTYTKAQQIVTPPDQSCQPRSSR